MWMFQPTALLTAPRSCSYCKRNAQASTKCDIVSTQQAQVELIKQDNLCFNCLGHHRVSRLSKKRCRQCRRKHHTSLCTNNTETPACNNPNSSPGSNSFPPWDTPTASAPTTLTATTLQSIHLIREPICLLKTAVATVTNKVTQVNAKILFNEGSQHSFATQVLIDKLQLQPHQTETIQLSAFGPTNPQVKKLDIANLQVIANTGTPISITVLIVPSIATPLENTVKTSILTHLSYLKGLQLVHPVTRFTVLKYLCWLVLTITGLCRWSHCWPTAVNSKLEYLLSGLISAVNPQQPGNTINLVCMVTCKICGLLNLLAFHRILCLTQMNNFSRITHQLLRISRCPDRSYMARFPWKEQHPPLPINFNIC